MATLETGKNIPTLRKENRALLEELQLLRARVTDLTRRVDVAEKASRDAWAFAKVAIRTGRPSTRSE